LHGGVLTDLPGPLAAPAATEDAAAARLHALADALSATLRVALALRRAGRAIDLTGLDDDLGRLCAGALDLPPPRGRLLRARLMTLRAELDVLAASLAPPVPTPTL
jgi:hypothetical protein